MSIYYTVKEKASIPAVADIHWDFIETMADRISKIIGNIVYSRGWIALDLNTKEGAVRCTEKDNLETWRAVLDKMRKADTLEVFLDYEYAYSLENDGSGITPYIQAEKAETAREESKGMAPDFSRNAFYEFWISADAEPDSGGCFAYGTKNGVFYSGKIPYHKVDSFPEGDWYEEATGLCIEEDAENTESYRSMLKACAELQKFGECVDFRVTDREVSYFLNNLTLHNAAEAEEFAKKLVPCLEFLERDSLEFLLEDTTPGKIATMRFTANRDGSYMVEVANTEP